MAQNDIYNSQKQWQTITKKIENGTYLKKDKKTKYYIKNPTNLKYFKKLIEEFNYQDISYIRRIQLFKALRITCFFSKKDIKDLNRNDVKKIITKTNTILKTTITRRTFVDLNKHIWKTLFPELDHKGRPDETLVPYAWRVKIKYDKSTKSDRPDKFTDTEFLKIMKRLNNDPRMQLWFSMIYYNLARPQELSYVDLDNVELFDNYARIRIASHGKEGTKTLQLIDNFYYLAQWLNKHPFWKDGDKKGKPLFLTMGNNSRYNRMGPKHANKVLRRVCKELGINKPISNYSFKRNGVTQKVLTGETPQSIQKTAGWTSVDQLKTYDLSSQEEFLEEELIKKGIIEADTKHKKKLVNYKLCGFCNEINVLTNDLCSNCKRPLNREDILKAEAEKDQKIAQMEETMAVLLEKMAGIDDLKRALELKKGRK